MDITNKVSFKPARLARMPLQDYQNRTYVMHLMDERHFDAMNTSGVREGCFLGTHGCIDALDILPAGSMKYICNNYYDASTIDRELTLKEVQAIDDYINSLR